MACNLKKWIALFPKTKIVTECLWWTQQLQPQKKSEQPERQIMVEIKGQLRSLDSSDQRPSWEVARPLSIIERDQDGAFAAYATLAHAHTHLDRYVTFAPCSTAVHHRILSKFNVFFDIKQIMVQPQVTNLTSLIFLWILIKSMKDILFLIYSLNVWLMISNPDRLPSLEIMTH